MGDPKFPSKLYDTPAHPWQGERIKAEQELVRKYGLRNKREIWKAQTILRNLRRQSRNLQARLRYGDKQAEIETANLLSSCGRSGLLSMDGSSLDAVLGLSVEKILDRRLQTIVYLKGLASSHKQARQMIIHGHVYMNGHKVTVPGYTVKRVEEESIHYNPNSTFNDDMHPIRMHMRNENPVVAETFEPVLADTPAPKEE